MSTSKHKSTTSHFSCCGFRKRHIMNKMLAIFLQVIVVVTVWKLAKQNERKHRSEMCEGQVMPEPSSDGDEAPFQLECKPGDYVEKKELRLSDVISISNGSDDSEEGDAISLKVDLFVRTSGSNTLTLFSTGSSVIVEDTNLSKCDTAVINHEENNDKAPPYDYVEFEMNKLENNDAKINEHQNQLDAITINDNMESKPASQINAKIAGVDSQVQNIGLIKGQIQYASPIENPEASYGNDGIPSQNAPLVPKQQIMDSVKHQQQFVPMQSQNMLAIQLHSGNQPQTGGSAQLDINNIMMNSNINNQQGDDVLGVQSQFPNDTPTENDYYDQGETDDYNNRDEDEESLYTSGFQDRIRMFKSEFYGKSLDTDSSDSEMNYLINNPSVCEGLGSVDVLFLIHTIPQNQELRNRIRSTYVKKDLFQPYSIAHVFLIGKTNSPNFQTRIMTDADSYGDIVQGDFDDEPSKRTQKGLMGMKWTLTFCPNAKHVLKINEDVFVDTQKLLKGFLPAVDKVIGKRAILCPFSPDAPIPRSGPNAVSPDVFPNSSKLRPYCKGYAVLMTQATVSSLVTASKHVPLCPLDDMFLYGIIPFLAGGIDVYDTGNKRAFHDFGMAVVKCYDESQNACPFVITKAFSARFTSLWEKAKARLEAGFEVDFLEASTSWNIRTWKKQF